MKKTISFLMLILLPDFICLGQQSSTSNTLSVQERLSEIEKTYHVRFIFNPSIISGVNSYIPSGTYSTSLKGELNQVLLPLGYLYNKISDSTYGITVYQNFHERTIKQGENELKDFLSFYKDSREFNHRKEELRKGFLKVMGINPLVKRPPLHPVYGEKRLMDGYYVQNIAFESIPGYYVTGTIYIPAEGKGPYPVILCPQGHFYDEKNMSNSQDSGRYAPQMQVRCEELAKMGAIVLNYDMYSWGESALETGGFVYHYQGFSLAIQTWNSMRCLDFLLSLPNVNKNKVGVTGASGGATQTILLAALDNRVTASVPVVMVSSCFDGGCECESGLAIRSSVRPYSNNTEIAAMFAPRPQLLISEDCDWTRAFPEVDLPYLKKVYSYYGRSGNVENVHLLNSHHNYGYRKRVPMYKFFAKVFSLNLNAIIGKDSKIKESGIIIQKPKEMEIFKDGLPSNALRSNKEIMDEFLKFFELPKDFFVYNYQLR